MANGARRTIAGYPAELLRFEIEVSQEGAGGALGPLPCDPIELFGLAEPERSIDATALLRERVISDPPYWALAWTGARAIAAALADQIFSNDCRVLDLGCGLGLAGFAALRSGATVTFGDYLEEPLHFIRETLADNPKNRAEVRTIDFLREDGSVGQFDVILAADIVYDPAHYAPLAGFLDRHLAPGGEILLTESLRADARVFLAGIVALGFCDTRSALWVMEEGRRERTWLHRLRRATAGS